MKATMLYGPGDVRLEERPDPVILEPTDAILRVSAAAAARAFTSTPSPFPLTGRSRMWPMLDFTTKSLPRYLLMVFAFAGDSTITRFFAI